MEDKFPVLVDRFTDEQILSLGCVECGESWVAQSIDDFLTQEQYGHCPKCNSYRVVTAYEEGDRCPNCQKLGFFDDVLRRCCSRSCMLQWEYALNLRGKQGLRGA